MLDMPRVLFIEDDIKWRSYVKELLESPPRRWREDLSLDRFQVEVAAWVDQAKQLLDKQQESDPYEVILLDIGLPRTKQDFDDAAAEDEHGCELLTWINDRYDIAVVVLTANPEITRNVLHAFRKGAMDFVGRADVIDDQGGQFLNRLVQAVGKTREKVYGRQERGRLIRLLKHRHRTERNRLSVIVYDRVIEICRGLEEISARVHPQEWTHSKIAGLTQKCAALTRALPPSHGEIPERPPPLDLGRVLAEECRNVRPCYRYREVGLAVTLPDEGTCEMAIPSAELRLLIGELLFESLERSPPGQTVELRCCQEPTTQGIAITATRAGEPVPAEVQEHLKQCDPWEWPSGPTWEEWLGLHFLQTCVDILDARLAVESDTDATRTTLIIG